MVTPGFKRPIMPTLIVPSIRRLGRLDHRFHRRRHPHAGADANLQTKELSRRDTDHRRRHVVDDNRLADDRGIRVQPVRPVRPADHGAGRSSPSPADRPVASITRPRAGRTPSAVKKLPATYSPSIVSGSRPSPVT